MSCGSARPRIIVLHSWLRLPWAKRWQALPYRDKSPGHPGCTGSPQWILSLLQMQYLQPLPGGCTSMEPSSFIDVYGYIATPRIWKHKSSLTWRLGPTHLFEEAISVETIDVIIKLGPQYCSNFQAVQLQGMWQFSYLPLFICQGSILFIFITFCWCSSCVTLKVWKTALLNVVQDCSKIHEHLVRHCELERRVGIKQQREMKSKEANMSWVARLWFLLDKC